MKHNIFRGLAVALTMSCLLSGCIPSVQLNKRAIVQAIGVDTGDEGYRITLQIFFPDGGDSGIDVGKQNAKLITAEGKTISDALQNATLKQGKKIFYGHNRLLVIGKQAAENGIQDILPFFNSGYESRPSTSIMMAETTAEDVLATNIKQGIVPAESLQNMVENHTENASVVKTRLIDMIEAIYDPSKSVAIPKVKLTEESKEGESSEDGSAVEATHAVTMDGTAVLKHNRLAGGLTSDETRGLVFLTDQVDRTLVVFPYRSAGAETDTMVSIDVYKSNTKTKVTVEDGIPVFHASVSALGRLNEISLSSRFSETEDAELLEQHAEALIREECEAAFRKAAGEYKADIFFYGKILMNQQKQLWSEREKRWPDAIGEAKLEVEVKLDIDRLGIQTDNREQ